MFTGFAFFAVVFQLAMFAGTIIFAVMLLNRMREISDSQRISAEAQAQLVKLLMQQIQCGSVQKTNASPIDSANN